MIGWQVCVDMGQYYCDEDEEGVCLYVLVYLVKCACNIIIIQGTKLSFYLVAS